MEEIRTFIRQLATRLMEQDPVKKGDVTYRLEGTLEALNLFVRSVPLPADLKEVVRDAVLRACAVFKMVEEVGRGANKQMWPTNRFAIELFAAMGIAHPTA